MIEPANRIQNRFQLRNRYLFKGQLVMQTALHIGGGKFRLSSSDSPVVLTPTGVPFIPGSSFKGALRSTVEKLVPALPEEAGHFTCGLTALDDKTLADLNQVLKQYMERWRNAKQDKDNILTEVKQLLHSRKACSTLLQRTFAEWPTDNDRDAEKIRQLEMETICATCQLFGSTLAASHVNISDLYMPANTQSDVVQIRDGVAIDRDSERARDGLKYDFEVVPVDTTFDLEITLENATPHDLQLLCVGLSEYVHGFGIVGGKRSRGLGACKIEHLEVSALELEVDEPERSARLRNFLLRREFSSVVPGSDFLDQCITSIFKE